MKRLTLICCGIVLLFAVAANVYYADSTDPAPTHPYCDAMCESSLCCPEPLTCIGYRYNPQTGECDCLCRPLAEATCDVSS